MKQALLNFRARRARLVRAWVLGELDYAAWRYEWELPQLAAKTNTDYLAMKARLQTGERMAIVLFAFKTMSELRDPRFDLVLFRR